MGPGKETDGAAFERTVQDLFDVEVEQEEDGASSENAEQEEKQEEDGSNQ